MNGNKEEAMARAKKTKSKSKQKSRRSKKIRRSTGPRER